MSKKRVTHIVLNNFKNDSRVLKEVTSLAKVGYTVNVIAIHDEGQKEQELIEKVDIRRLKLKTRRLPKVTYIQVFKYVEFICRALKLMKQNQLVHCHDLNALVVGVLAKVSKKNIVIIYDAHELETEVVYDKGIMKRIKKAVESFCIKYVERTITVSESISRWYEKQYNISKPEVLYNCPPLIKNNRKELNIFRKKFNIPETSLIFLYQGGLTFDRGVEEVIEAFKTLDMRFCVIFMGYGPLQPFIEKASKSYENIFYHDAVDPIDLNLYTSSADIGFSLIQNTCLSFNYCLPNKLFEYISANVPVVVSNLEEMAEFIKKYKVGYCLEYKNTEKLVEFVRQLDRNALCKFSESLTETSQIYNWEQQEIKLISLYQEVLG